MVMLFSKAASVSHAQIAVHRSSLAARNRSLVPLAAREPAVGDAVKVHAAEDVQAEFDANWAPVVPEHVWERNARLAERLRGKLLLAPLTRGSHPAFRRLCAAFGCEATMSEMAYARMLIKRDRKEVPKLRRCEGEELYGLQVATKAIDEGVRAAEMAAEHGAAWLDVNCGCPIYGAMSKLWEDRVHQAALAGASKQQM